MHAVCTSLSSVCCSLWRCDTWSFLFPLFLKFKGKQFCLISNFVWFESQACHKLQSNARLLWYLLQEDWSPSWKFLIFYGTATIHTKSRIINLQELCFMWCVPVLQFSRVSVTQIQGSNVNPILLTRLVYANIGVQLYKYKIFLSVAIKFTCHLRGK